MKDKYKDTSVVDGYRVVTFLRIEICFNDICNNISHKLGPNYYLCMPTCIYSFIFIYLFIYLFILIN